MPLPPAELQRRILDDWTAAAAGWREWEPHIVAFTWPMTLAMLEALDLRPGQRALDVGCGIGDPALAMARPVGPRGRVLALDPTPEMLATARDRAAALGLDNIDFRRALVEEVDFEPASFDAIAGRWSFIFCVDVAAQLARARAWLRPGGRMAVATWTPQQFSPGFEAINTALNRVASLPPLDATKPGRLRLSDPGQLEAALAAAGLRDVSVFPVQLSIFARDGDEFWRLTSQMGGSLHAVIRGLRPDQREAVRTEVVAAVEKFRAAGGLRIPAQAQLGIGTAG
jgi:ubiquinone/menaquinone biosynthesis C-methylase UbiE